MDDTQKKIMELASEGYAISFAPALEGMSIDITLSRKIIGGVQRQELRVTDDLLRYSHIGIPFILDEIKKRPIHV